jgi:transcriptional regulator with XRE-family HTH domain
MDPACATVGDTTRGAFIVGVAPPPSTGSTQEARRQELADFLRTRRAAVRPADHGLRVDGRRRTPGLRREEVAQLAGVGLSWYTWLEQGRDIRPSAQVLDALSRALRLTTVERAHLFALARVERPLPDRAYARSAPGELRAAVQALMPNPAYLTGPRLDVLAFNDAAATVLCDFGAMAPERRNLLWWLFGGDGRWERVATWEQTAKRNLGHFRAEHARHPGDPSFAALVDELSEVSPEFRDWWPRHEVIAPEPGSKTIEHPDLGTLNLLHLSLTPASEPDLRMVLLLPADAPTRAALEGAGARAAG